MFDEFFPGRSQFMILTIEEAEEACLAAHHKPSLDVACSNNEPESERRTVSDEPQSLNF